MVSSSIPALTVGMFFPPTVDGSGPPIAINLQVEQIDKQIQRTVSIIPLPALVFTPKNDNDIFDQRPVAWVLDLGLIQETLTLRGLSNDDNANDLVPTIGQLEEIVRCVSIGIGSLTSVTGASFNRLVGIEMYNGHGTGAPAGSNPPVSSTPTYSGVILSFAASRQSGQLFWTWTLTLGVCNWARVLFQNQFEGFPP